MNNKHVESGIFKASRFLNIYKRENTCCLIHSLTQHKVFGGDILSNLFELFANPVRIEDVVAVLSLTYPTNIIHHVIEDLKHKGGKGSIITGDVTKENEVINIFSQLMSEYKRLDIIANIAGGDYENMVAVDDISYEKMSYNIDVNLKFLLGPLVFPFHSVIRIQDFWDAPFKP